MGFQSMCTYVQTPQTYGIFTNIYPTNGPNALNLPYMVHIGIYDSYEKHTYWNTFE